MSNYLHPYCTIDKLRISKANGIRFIYLTDSEGSFFDGENIPDNEFYNDQSNCGFNWEPFAQQIPCDGTVRFQFQWCDDRSPLVHVFENGTFLYELTPSLVSDGEYAIYEQEINFSTETDLCNSCIDIRIATLVEGGLSAYIDSSENKVFVRTSVDYIEYPIDEGYVPTGIHVYSSTGIILVASDIATNTKVYKWTGSGFDSVYSTSSGVFSSVVAFSDTDWCVVSNTTLGVVLYSKNGTVTEDVVVDPSYFYGVWGKDIDNIYAFSQMPFSNIKIFARQSGTWNIYLDVTASSADYGRRVFKVMDETLFMILKKAGNVVFYKVPLSGSDSEVVVASGNPVAFSIVDNNNISVISNDSLYNWGGASFAIDTDFTALRSEKGDSSILKSIDHLTDDMLIVASSDRIYLKNGTWSELSGGDYATSTSFYQVDGNYSESYAYHAQSEPIKISNAECLKKIEYWNDDDYDYQVFCQGFRNIVYVQMQQTAFRPMEERTEYTTSQNVRKVLSSNLSQITVWDLNYMPQYLHEILWRTFGMDNVEVDGVSYTKEGDYSITENSAPYSLWKSSVELYKNLFKFTNSNCNRCIPSTRGGIGVMIIGDTFIVT